MGHFSFSCKVSIGEDQFIQIKILKYYSMFDNKQERKHTNKSTNFSYLRATTPFAHLFCSTDT